MRPGLDLVSTRDVDGVEIKIYGSYSRNTSDVDYDFFEVYADDMYLQTFPHQPPDSVISTFLQ